MKKRFLLILLATILPLAMWADVWQDPETNVKYEYTVGNSEAKVLGRASGPIYIFGDIVILSTFTVNENVYSVTSIGNYAFSDCKGITSITIPNSVTTIGNGAFVHCASLTSITIPNSVTTIGNSAFAQCASLTSITIPNSVTSIGDYAFSECTGLTSITIPYSVTSIGRSVFSYCNSLTSIVVSENNTKYDSRENCNAIIETASNILIQGCLNTSIPNSVTSIGNFAFHSCASLTSITIPNSVTTIGDYAFGGCASLTSITIPNSVTSIGGYAFSNCTSLTSITIPNSVTSIGGSAFEDCTGLTSITIGSSVTSIGFFAFNCTSPTSITSLIREPFPIGQVFSWDTYGSATLFVPAGTIAAYNSTSGWENFNNIREIDGGLTLTLTLAVTDERGEDLTDKVIITWYNAEGQLIGTGASLSGIEDGIELHYSVTLDEELGRVYQEVTMQKVIANGEAVTCQLEKIGRVTLEGRVSATDIDKNTMTVNVKQMLNGKWGQTYLTQTDEQGVFSVEVYDDQTDITVSGDGYLDATLHRDSFSGNGDVGTIPVSLISGFAIAANITMKAAAAEGEENAPTVWTDALNNIDFSLNNKAKGTVISDFTVQNGSVIIKTGATTGDEINLAAKSKQGIFADAATTFTIEDGANSFDLQLTELGGVDATCAASSNGSTVGYLYDSNGTLAAKGSYVGEMLSLRHLRSGAYTLVSMGNSMLLGSMTQLSDITATGLSEGTDYVTASVTVTDGELAAISVSEVPRLNEEQFYYTSNETYFSANKPSVTAGNYLTLQAHVDFKPEYADKADGVMLTIDLPEGCEMVANSVIANRAPVAHSVNGSRVTMQLSKEQYGSQVRFCIIPTLNQNYTVTAMAQFDIDGQVTQPIGTAQFEAKGLSLSVAKQTDSTNVTINGTAKGHSDVNIYDNDVLIGKTSSKADGSWTAQCELYKPNTYSFHDIYAKIVTDGGMELTSETQQVEYDKNMLVPEKVAMTYYNGWYGKNINVEFDLINGTTLPSSYPFYHGTDFTFLADFTRNDTTAVKNVNIKVLNSDGTVRTLPAVFNGKQGKWVATTKYTNSGRLPKNATVEYDYIYAPYLWDEEMEEAMETLVNNMQIEVENAYKDCEIEITDNKENSVAFTATTNGYETKENFRFSLLDYQQVKAEYADKLFFHIEDDDDDFCFDINELDNGQWSVVAWDNVEQTACELFAEGLAPTNLARKHKIVPLLLSAGYGVAFSIGEYYLRKALIKSWQKSVTIERNNRRKSYDRANEMLYAKCPDGSYKIKDASTMDNLSKELSQCWDDTETFLADFQDMVDKQHTALKQLCTVKGVGNVLLSGAGKAANTAGGLLINEAKNKFMKKLGEVLVTKGAGAVVDLSVGALSAKIPNPVDAFVNPEQVISEWYHENVKEIINEHVNISKKIKNAYSECKKEPKENAIGEEELQDKPQNESTTSEIVFPAEPSKPIIDPSGFVYEAVLSNRLEGVTTTCYEKVNDEAVLWNAEDYSQQNPLKTDATGFYRWDVPMGMWQVKYEKEGYETAYSEWLPVPPPQLDVNIGMKQSTPPTVKQMRGYESGITIDMSKYMLPGTMNGTNITVTRNGSQEKGTVELLNAEQAPLSGETYVQKVKFVPQNRFHVTDNVVVTVHKDVESYCGVKMTADHVETVKIEPEITAIVADSLITVNYQGSRDVQVLVLPKDASAGRTLHIKTSSDMIASVNTENVKIDQNGLAKLTISGELPGGAVLDFTIDGTDMTATSKVKVVMGRDMVAVPVANIQSGSMIEGGSQIVLSCATEGATIYYTLDGSCPCDEATRHKYDGPITIATNVVVKAIAVKEGMDDSDIATFIYMVNGINDITAKDRFKASYADGTLTITGADGGSIRVFDLLGRELVSRKNASGNVSIRVPKAESYIVSVTFTDGNTVVRKVTR